MPSDLHQSGMGTDVEGRPNILGVLGISKRLRKEGKIQRVILV
jgi:hypothetical protein